MNAVRVPWSSASFLAYLGGLTILGALSAMLVIAAEEHGAGGFTAWSLLIFAIVTALAVTARTAGHRVTAGLLALSSVVTLVAFIGSLFDWFGWLPDSGPERGFDGFSVSLLVLELSLAASAAIALRIFRFPLLVLPLVVGAWVFLTDLLSNGGDWSAVVTLLFGLALLPTALVVDSGETRPFGFWIHVVSGLTIGGGLLWFFHDGDVDWILIGVAALAYVAFGDRLLRSSWVVLGGWALLQVAAHWAEKWSQVALLPFFYLFPFAIIFGGPFDEGATHPWAAALVFAITGALLMAIGLLLARRRRGVIPGAELL